MYLQSIEGILPGQRVQIKYDCNNGQERCGKEYSVLLKVAQKNAANHNGKHICRQCQLKANNPVNRPGVVEKMRKTCKERYGEELPLNSQDNIQKRREQFLDEQFRERWNQKHKETNLERYGVEHHMHVPEIKERIKNTVIEKYGVENVRQYEGFKKKSKETCLEKYGVENAAQSEEVKQKQAKTMLDRYGVEHYNELPEMREYMKEHGPKWLAESWTNPWAKGITRPEEWNQKGRETISNLIIAGEWKSGYPSSRKGFCYPKKSKKERVYFRSSYEAIYCYYLDHNDEVAWFSFESFRIPYYFNGKTRYYVPDFLIGWTNMSVSIHELKAEFLKEDEQTVAKQKAGILYANEHNFNYEILTNNHLISLNITFDYLKEIGYVK